MRYYADQYLVPRYGTTREQWYTARCSTEYSNWTCTHKHQTRDEAQACADAMLPKLAEADGSPKPVEKV